MSDSNPPKKTDVIDEAIEMATTGDPSEAIRLLWPVMLQGTQRDQAMFALAFCYEKAQNFSTAHYLYEEIALRYPSFTVAVDRQQACQQLVIERGLIEDFQDMGHRECMACTLRFRSEYLLCPYCGSSKDYKKPSTEKKEQAQSDEPEEVPLPSWEDPTLLDALQDMGRDVADRIQDLVESDTVKNASEKMNEASKATVKKAKEFAASEKAQELKKKSAKLGDGVFNKAQKLSEKPAIRDLAHKIEDVGNAASDKVKEVLQKESTQNAKVKVQKFGASIMDKIREALNPPKKDD